VAGRGRKFIPPLGPPRLSPRDRALAQWRGESFTRDEQVWATRAKPVAGILPRVLGGLGLERKLTEAEIPRVWAELIDPRITAHAQPTGLVRGTLFVTVDSSPWLDEIVRYRRKEILDRLQHSFGRETVKRISFRVG